MSHLARQLVDAVVTAGGTIQLEGPNLRLRAPAPLPDDLRAALREHKAEVVAFLSPPTPANDVAVDSQAPWEPGPWSDGIPDDWARGIGLLMVAAPLAGFPKRRWRTLIRDTMRLLETGHIVQAAALGWQAADLFGCDPRAPYHRGDRLGLVPLLDGHDIASLSQDSAVIHVRDGVTHSFRRRPPDRDASLLWSRRRPSTTGPPPVAQSATTNAGGGTALAGVAATLATKT